MKFLFIRKIEALNRRALLKTFQESFGDPIDFEFVILKGHILVEYAINLSIEKLAYKRANAITEWPFKSKLTFVEALGIFEGSEGNKYLEQIKALTNMRNSIAHSMKYAADDVSNLIKYYPTVKRKIDSYKRSNLKDYEIDLYITGLISFIIPVIYNYILTRLQSKITLNNFCFDAVDDRMTTELYKDEVSEMKSHLEISELTFDAYP